MADGKSCSTRPADHRRLAGVTFVAAAVTCLLVGDAIAQQVPLQFRVRPKIVGPGQPGDPNEDQSAEGVFHGDREVRKQLKKAKQLLKDGRYSEALPLLDDILEKSQDFFDGAEPNQVARNGVKSEAQRLIGEQSAEGLKAYELLFGPKAERMLSDALTAGDMTAVAEVARRYFHTRAGYDATLLLGRHQLDHDEPLAAALCFQRLLTTPAAEKYQPGLSVMLAACWLRGGMDERARQVMLELKKQNPTATVRLAGQEVRLFSTADEAHAMAWLTEKFGASKTGGSLAAANWAMNRGNPARNATSAGGMPLLNPTWRVPIVPNPDEEKAVNTARQDALDRSLVSIPVAQPLAVGDSVLMRTRGGLLIGVNFRSGKRVWDNHMHLPSPPDRPSTGSVRVNGMIVNQDGLFDRLWENATYTTLSSDGDYVFEVEDVNDGNPPVVQMQRRAIWRQPGFNGQIDGATNELAAYEPSTEGKCKWRVGGHKKDFEVEPQLEEAYFLGPPLPLMGRVYVLAEMKGEIRLVVLDAKTGRMDWAQQLASPDEQNVLGSSFRHSTGVSPSYADGILICPTSAGAVVAVDVANRALVWGYEYPHPQQQNYPQPQIIMRNGMMTAYGPQNYLGDRWSDATATIAEGCVLLTPVESDKLFCLSLIDGKLLWSMDRGEYVYPAGALDGKVLMVGRKQLQAFRLADGKPAWTDPLLLPQGSVPSGRGFISGGRYYLPLSSAEVAAVDIGAGKIVARSKSRKGIIPGNLICYKGSVISQQADSVDRFFQIEPLKEEVSKALTANPNDAQALANLGNIELDEGKVSEAIGHVRKSYEILAAESQDKAASSRELLVEALLANLARDFAGSRSTVDELEKLVVFERERVSLLRQLAQGLGKTGDRLGALDAYLKLVDLPAGRGEPEVIGNDLSVRRDRWIRARIDELYASAANDERTKFDAAVADRLSKALAAKQPKDLRKFVAVFGFHPAADEAREQLFAQLTQPETLVERELLLDDLMHSADQVRRRAAVARMAMLLNEANKFDDAAVFYHRLETEFADVVCTNGKTGKQLVEGLAADSPIKRTLGQTTPWPEGTVRKESTDVGRIGRNQNIPRPYPLTWRGDRPAVYQNVSIAFDQQQQMVVGHDGVGRERFRVSINESNQNRLGFQPIAPDLNFASAQGHLLLVNLGNQVMAIDTLRQQGNGGRILWQQELVEMMPNVFNGQQAISAKEIRLPWGAARHVPVANGNGQWAIGVVGPLVNRCVVVQRSHDLTAFDPLTGDILWSRRGIDPGSEVFGDDEVLIVTPPDGAKDSDKAIVVRTMDGEMLGTRPVPKPDRRWAYCGRRCLWGRNEADGKWTFLLSDPWKQTDRVLGTFDAGVKSALIGTEEAAFLEPSGRLLLVALADARKIIDLQLDPESALDNIAIQRTVDQYLLLANRAATASGAAAQPMPPGVMMPDGSLAVPANGHIYAFDRESGKPLWPVPASVENYNAVLSQGSDLPVIVLLKMRAGGNSGATGDNEPSVLFLDRRTGRSVLSPGQEFNPQLAQLSCDVSGDRERRSITLSVPTAQSGQSVTLRFTTDPTPPEPPYQTGLLAKRAIFGSNAAGSVLRAIFPGAEDTIRTPKPADDPFK